MTELPKEWLQPGAVVPVNMDTVRLLLDAVRALSAPVQPTCPDCGKVNPAEIHTCSPQAQVQVSDDARTTLYRAAITCAHDIDKDKVILRRDPKKEGNALAQLADRLAEAHAALLSSAPADELRRLRQALWDCFRIAGGDTDGDATPDALVKRDKYFAVDADVYITNIDAAVWLLKQKPKFFEKFDTLIIDEITKYKHHTSARSRAINKIKKYFTYRTGMTGTPNSNTICDVWHPAFIIDDGKRLGTSFFAFRSTVCRPEQVGPSANMVKWIDKDGAEEAVFDLLSDITIRHRFEECMDIPETFKTLLTYDLPVKQLRAYKEMEKTQMMLLQQKGEIKAVTAINAATVRTKLLQIASGAVYESPEKYHLVDTGRYELTMDLVEDRKHPLVFFLWKHQRDYLVAEARKRGLKFCVFDGNATDKQREEMEREYQSGFYDVMLAHPETVAHGLTLTKGTSTIWPSPTDNLEWWAQGNRRQARGGQTEKTEVLIILASGTIETRVYDNLLVKNGRMDNFLTLFAEAA